MFGENEKWVLSQVLLWKVLIFNLISLYVIDLFIFSNSPWVGFRNLCLSRNVPILSKLFNLLLYSSYILIILFISGWYWCSLIHSWFRNLNILLLFLESLVKILSIRWYFQKPIFLLFLLIISFISTHLNYFLPHAYFGFIFLFFNFLR